MESVTYEDGSSYNFSYSEGDLMTEEVEPNGNRFTHQFDENGRVVKVSDELEGYKEYIKNSSEYIVKTALGNRESIFMSGLLNQEVTSPSGQKRVISFENDGMTKIIKSCNLETITHYTLDSKTGDEIVKEQIVKLPSGKALSSIIERSYAYNEDNSTKTYLVKSTQNSISTISETDYNEGVTTTTSPMGRVSKTYFDKENLLNP